MRSTLDHAAAATAGSLAISSRIAVICSLDVAHATQGFGDARIKPFPPDGGPRQARRMKTESEVWYDVFISLLAGEASKAGNDPERTITNAATLADAAIKHSAVRVRLRLDEGAGMRLR